MFMTTKARHDVLKAQGQMFALFSKQGKPSVSKVFSFSEWKPCRPFDHTHQADELMENTLYLLPPAPWLAIVTRLAA